MHKNRSKSWLSVIICLIALSFSFSLFADKVAVKDTGKITVENAKIENFVVEDIPDDAGNGLILKWKPLPNELKILEYRIYRGTSKDSLFYLGSVVLNPVVGFAGNEITYLDSGYKPFVDKGSPGRLRVDRKVKTENTKTKYFGTDISGYPRDLKILEQANGKFNLLAQIEKSSYYNRYVPVEVEKEISAEDPNSEEASKPEKEIFAGYPVGNVSVLASIKEGVTYYYSVVPINQNRTYLKPSQVVSGTPIQDPLMTPAQEIFASLILDGDQPIELNFDWENGSGSYASQVAIYVFDEDYEIAKTYFDSTDENEYIGKEPFIIELDEQTNIYGKKSFDVLVENGQAFLKNDKQKFLLDIENISNYPVAIQANTGAATFINENTLEKYRSIFTQDLKNTPKVPVFNVYDLPNDKGDTQVIVWEKPIVEITKTSFDTHLGNKLVINYDYLDNQSERLDEFTLKLFLAKKNAKEAAKEAAAKAEAEKAAKVAETARAKVTAAKEALNTKTGPEKEALNADLIVLEEQAKEAEFAAVKAATNAKAEVEKELFVKDLEINEDAFFTTTEFYLNNIIKLTLPEDYNNNTIVAKVEVKTDNPDTGLYTFTQVLQFDKILKALIPSAIEKDGILLNSFNYEVYAKSGSDIFKPIAPKVVGKMNNYSDVISYERFLYEPVKSFDSEANKVVTGSSIQVWYDSSVEKSLYLDKFPEKSKELLVEEIETIKEEIEAEEDVKYKNLLTIYLGSLNEIKEKLDGGMSQSKWIKLVKSYRDDMLRQRSYKVFATNNKGLFASYELPQKEDGTYQYFTPISNQFDQEKWAALIASIIFAILVAIYINLAKKGTDLYIRPIAGVQEIDNAIGRATEMGRPILFVPGMSSIAVVATLAALSILGKVAKKAAEYDTRILVPTRDYILMPIAQEIVKEAHVEAGRPDTYDKNSVFFVTTDQFAYVAGVNGIMIREKTATNFYMGSYFAESLLMTETGNITGAIQIAGTDSVTQIPFFITTCDYTLIGEELYAASAMMSKEPMILGTLKAQDYFKFIVLFFIILGTILSTSKITFLLDIFPDK